MSEFSPFNGSEIAIIGLAGRFPGAKNLDLFWHNLQNGVESIFSPMKNYYQLA
jgi:acyl transferase domain-containing protein